MANVEKKLERKAKVKITKASIFSRKWQRMTDKLLNFIFYLILLIGVVTMIGPFVWMALSSMKAPIEILRVPPTLFPKDPTLENFREVLRIIPFIRYYFNSTLVSVVVTLIALFINSLAGYTFAKFRFFGRNILFLIILATMMIPFQLMMIPLYLIMCHMNLVNTYGALIIPGLVSAFGIFLMRQFIETLPNSLIDCARIDGCSEFGIFMRIILPLIKPALATLGIFIFMWTWNDYLWPLIVINSMHLRTLPIGLAMLETQHSYKYGLILAATTMTVGPIIGVFLFFQRWFIRGITLSGLKG